MNCNVAICVPSSGICQAFFTQSLANLVNECKGKSLNDIGPVQFILIMQQGSVIHQNRETLVDNAIKANADYILFLDDDMAFHHDAFWSALGRRQPVVVTNYPQRQFPIKFTCLEKDGVTQIQTTEKSTGIQSIGFAGFGFALIHTSVFTDLPKPWFLPKYSHTQNLYTTEDYPFYEKVHQSGHSVFLDHDASKLLAHCGQHLYRWNQQGETNAA